MLRFLNIALLGAAIGAGLGYLSFCRLPPDYRSTARLVIPSPIQPVDTAAEQRAAAEQSTARPVQQAERTLTADATLELALQNSELIPIRSASGGALSLEQVRQSLQIDESDEPPDVIVVHCRAPSAQAAQAILISVIDAYLVLDGRHRDAGENETARLIQQARADLGNPQGRIAAEASLRKLIESWGTPVDDPAPMQLLSQQRAALLLRRNSVLRQIAQIERGQPAMPAESAAAPPGRQPRNMPGSAAPGPGVGSQEREAQLLEEDSKLALRYGPEHPKRKAIRLQIELLQKYPAEQAQLLAERSELLEQYGPSHPRLQAIEQRLAELGIVPPTPAAASTATGLLLPAGSTDSTPESRLKTLRAALEELNAEDGALKRQIESVMRARELSAELRQVLNAMPAAGGNVPAVDAALDRLEQLSGEQTAIRPYLAMRPTPGIRSDAGMLEKILRGAIAGLALGGVVACGILWAGRRK
jgi:hypothetical protein